jgi:beta-glucuronidase
VKAIRCCRPGAGWVGAWLALQVACNSLAAARPQLDLTGVWDFYPGAGDAPLEGLAMKPGKIVVPGAWQAQGYGQPGGSIPSSVVGSDITPSEYLRHNLTARCLYARQIEVPSAWRGRRVFLCARRVYRYADVTVNGRRIGDYEGFSSPFEFDVTEAIRFGRANQFVVGVDNRARPGRDTVGMANYFSNTGGFGGAVYLEARPADWIQEVFAIPKIAAAQAQIRVTLKTVKAAWPGGMDVSADVAKWDANGQPTASAGRARQTIPPAGTNEFTLDLPVTLDPLRLWSPDEPFLYTATVRLVSNGRSVDEREVRFGMREIVAQGRKLFLNGKPLYLSGYGDDTTEPLTSNACV